MNVLITFRDFFLKHLSLTCYVFIFLYINYKQGFCCDDSIHTYIILWSSTSSVTVLSSLPKSYPLFKKITRFYYDISRSAYNTLCSVHPHHAVIPPFPFPSPLKSSAFYVYVLFKSRVCMWKKAWDICVTESGLFHLTWWSPIQSIFMQIISTYSSFFLKNTQLCIL
jgi:hypothetical protein